MYSEIGTGQRKYLQESDYEILRNAGYTVIPVPGAALLTVMGTGMVGWLRRRNAV